MKVEFKRSFVKDLERVRHKGLKKRVKQIITQIEEKQTLQEIGNVKRLRGGERYYRIRMGDYRLGLMLEEDMVIFVRFLHRKDIYRYFP
ncbi:MAG TPA: type II toxin-antitoxin system RelE/ParE family toxin [Thermoflexia bacterium]|nr:type II toxin-antitoxin system RelE/ParE family toxin [Thermoflexia bacterium]